MLPYLAFLFPCLCGSFWIIPLGLRWKRNPVPVRTGAIALLWMVISILIRAASLTEVYQEGGWYLWDSVEVFSTLTFFACLILYFRTWTDQAALGWKEYGVFLPGLLGAGILLFLYLAVGENRMTPFIREVVHSYNKSYPGLLERAYDILYFYLYKIVALLFANIAFVYAWIRMVRRKMPRRNFALRFLFMAILFTAFIISWDYLAFVKAYTFMGIGMFLWGCSLYYFGFHLANAESPVEQITGEEVKHERQESNAEEHTDEETWNKIKEKLAQLMEEKVFLQPDLRLEDLALRAHTNRTYLARLLREEYGYGFPEYISRQRIAYACQLIQEQPNLTLEQLAEKTGYLYGSTFSRAFKQYTGVTFREWKKKA
ncbi:helix-turn-helix transcriptional regulator [Parabacteroides sp. PF5-6]|uniref:helix-turn-helix domain-containing protein n=1 Tax=Parabacteroides sp. PF5-6 TaxID=1742403 RepID=UPI0024049BDA|nr:helix-turn-helix transcriptional regulator [Parabacteroides sp. PF5-6]MDF9829856.1 AraC-like DNA-binding protein [Parabacteroides sp. PF5-6]